MRSNTKILIWHFCSLSIVLGACTGGMQATQASDTVLDADAAAVACADAGVSVQQQQQQQQRSQQLTESTLQAVSAGNIKTASALSLLQDLAALHASLASGAAAARWDKSRDNQQKQQHNHAPAQGSNPQPSQNTHGLQQAAQPRLPTRGILVVAGGGHQLRNAYILLTLLWHANISCTLPIEIVYYGAQEYDPSVVAAIQQRSLTAGVSVKFLDGSAVPPTGSVGLEPHRAPGRITGFKAKVHALVWVTSFDQVLMLDSDNTPLTNPTPLFDSTLFKTHGSIAWPDFWTNQWMQPAIYSLLGLDTPWVADPAFRACEAGQLLLDRLRHHDVLEYLWLLNAHSNSGIPGAELGVVGQCLWGDKDTYPIAFHLAGKAVDFASVQHMPLQALSRPAGSGSSRLVHAGMVHRAPWGTGPLMWLHRTAAGKFWPHCMAHGGASCRVWALTTPVDQQQLLAVVRDPSAMEMDTSQVDLDWRKQHCSVQGADTSSSEGAYQQDGNPAAGGDAAGTAATAGHCSVVDGECEGLVDAVYTNSTVLHCDFEKAMGVVPIPVLRTKHLPAQVKQLLQAAQEAFAATKQITVG